MRYLTTLLLVFSFILPLKAQQWTLEVPDDSLAIIVNKHQGDHQHFAALYTQVNRLFDSRTSANLLAEMQPMVDELYELAETLGPAYTYRATLAEQLAMISVCPNGEPSIYTDSAKVLVRRIHDAIKVPENADEADLLLRGYLKLAFLCDRIFFEQDSFQMLLGDLLDDLPNVSDSMRVHANLMLVQRLRIVRKPGDQEWANSLMQETLQLLEGLSGAYELKHKANQMMVDHHYHTTGDTARIRYFVERSLESLSRLPLATARDSFNIYWALFEGYHAAEDYTRALSLVDVMAGLSFESNRNLHEMLFLAHRLELLALMDSTTNAPYLERALSMLDTTPELIPDVRAEVLGASGLYALNAGDDQRALRLLRQFAESEAKMLRTSGQLLLFDRGHIQSLRSRGLAALAGLEAARGNHAAASGYYQRAIEKKDLQASIDKQLLRSQAAYSLDVAENQRLRDRAVAQSELSRQRAASDRKMLFWGLGIAALVAALIAFAYWRARQDRQIIAKQKAVVDAALSEKEILLREIHHRVKNNLQIISSLLQKQARISGDASAKQFAKEGQERIQSMALVHENLYQSEQLNGVNIRDYLEDLAVNVKQSHDPTDTEVVLDLRVENTQLNLDTAIPIGLILNELLTNAYKYAFTNRKTGSILVALTKKAAGYQLSVSDDGVGLPSDHVNRRKQSLGHNLVIGLVRQLEGSVQWLRGADGRGTNVTIQF